MNRLNGLARPALLIIGLMVLINAGLFFYFDHLNGEADKKLQNQVTQNEKIASENRQLIKSQENERLIRSDQNCETAERVHLRDVQDLRGSYALLESAELNPPEKNAIIYKLVIKGLPNTIASGETDVAPDYCDEKGYGLKEPDPVVPKRLSFLPESIYEQADKLKSLGLQLDNQPIESNTEK